jgi:hypothetical protein
MEMLFSLILNSPVKSPRIFSFSKVDQIYPIIIDNKAVTNTNFKRLSGIALLDNRLKLAQIMTAMINGQTLNLNEVILKKFHLETLKVLDLNSIYFLVILTVKA